MSKKNKKRVVVATYLDKDKDKNYKDIWDEIIKSELEKKYGKIKKHNV